MSFTRDGFPSLGVYWVSQINLPQYAAPGEPEQLPLSARTNGDVAGPVPAQTKIIVDFSYLRST